MRHLNFPHKREKTNKQRPNIGRWVATKDLGKKRNQTKKKTRLHKCQ